MARRFLERRDSSRGTPFLNFSDSTVPPILTHGGSGTRKGKAMSRSTPSKKSSTDSSASGYPRPMEISIDPDRIYYSIREQQYEIRKPAWVLMSPMTCYELQRVGSDWVYLGGSTVAGSKPKIVVMGIPVKELVWMPDGIVVVTDNFVEDPLSGAWRAFKTDALYRSFEDYKVKVDWVTTGFTTTTAPIGTSYFFDTGGLTTTTAAGSGGLAWKADGAFTFFEGHPKEPSKEKVHDWVEEGTWADPVVESQEPDPESIYGQALARARARIPYKKAEK